MEASEQNSSVCPIGVWSSSTGLSVPVAVLSGSFLTLLVMVLEPLR